MCIVSLNFATTPNPMRECFPYPAGRRLEVGWGALRRFLKAART